VVIRSGEDDDRVKLELAIIENLQREDLNPIDRALAFNKLATDFGLKHIEIGKRVGKSREYVSNTLRILLLPQEMQDSLARGDISEGHTRPLLMLMDKPEEQKTLFHEIVLKKLTVRDSEQLARRVAVEKSRKGDLTPELLLLERELTESLGTRVRIEKKDQGGKLLIDFFSAEDLAHIRRMLSLTQNGTIQHTAVPAVPSIAVEPEVLATPEIAESESVATPEIVPPPVETSSKEEEDLYSIKNFSL
jgi:ParB family chromosome partitioning protein